MKLSAKAADMIEKAKAIGWDLGLSSIKALLNELNNPQDKIPAIHVTGTNGKGSVCQFTDSILVEAGLKVGKYTSPQIDTIFERFCINDSWITADEYNELLDEISQHIEPILSLGFRHPSLFELETVLAYLYFYKKNCDIMIIEVGMGGLLDATNVINKPKICVFTSIGLDHQQWLGQTIEKITQNKAGIITPGSFIVSAIQNDKCRDELLNVAKTNDCTISYAKPLDDNYVLGLEGQHQYQNAACAVTVINILNNLHYSINEVAIREGLRKATLRYRFEHISSTPDIILDGAHNEPAIKVLANHLANYYSNKSKTFIISVLADKNYEKMFSIIMPMANRVIVVQSSSDRALELNKLSIAVKKYVTNDTLVESADSFKKAALSGLNKKDDMIICFGTFTFLADMRQEFKELGFSD